MALQPPIIEAAASQTAPSAVHLVDENLDTFEIVPAEALSVLVHSPSSRPADTEPESNTRGPLWCSPPAPRQLGYP